MNTQEIKELITEVEVKIANNKNIIQIMTTEGNTFEIGKAKKHLSNNEGKLIEYKQLLKSKRRKKRVTLEDKVDGLREEYHILNERYGDEYGSNDGSWDCEELLRRLKEIETTFRCLGM